MMLHGQPEDLAALRREEIRREVEGDRLVALARREGDRGLGQSTDRSRRSSVAGWLILLQRSVQAQLTRIQHDRGIDRRLDSPEQVEAAAKLDRQQVGEA